MTPREFFARREAMIPMGRFEDGIALWRRVGPDVQPRMTGQELTDAQACLSYRHSAARVNRGVDAALPLPVADTRRGWKVFLT